VGAGVYLQNVYSQSIYRYSRSINSQSVYSQNLYSQNVYSSSEIEQYTEQNFFIQIHSAYIIIDVKRVEMVSGSVLWTMVNGRVMVIVRFGLGLGFKVRLDKSFGLGFWLGFGLVPGFKVS
jgi:hypothetical protein